jgi:acid phosphatase
VRDSGGGGAARRNATESGGGPGTVGAVRSHALAALLLALVSLASGATGSPRIPRFRHVLVVVFENHERSEIVGSPDAPTFSALARRYASLTAYDPVAHPSLPNYLALVSGSTQGITSDCTSCVVDGPSLADELEHAGLTWKTYAEGLPAPGFTGASAGLYAKRHDPFLYFRDVAARPARRDRIVPFTRLRSDLASGRLPDYALVVPNLCDDMHDCSVARGDRWLRTNIVPLLARPQLRSSVVFVVFDEGTTDAGGGGHVDALALGPLVRRGGRFALPTSHYGLLRTIEDAWGLLRLGQSARARPITGIWR